MGRAKRAEQGPGIRGSHQMPPQSWQIPLPRGRRVLTSYLHLDRMRGPLASAPRQGHFTGPLRVQEGTYLRQTTLKASNDAQRANPSLHSASRGFTWEAMAEVQMVTGVRPGENTFSPRDVSTVTAKEYT